MGAQDLFLSSALQERRPDKRPNFVYVLMDDMAKKLGDEAAVPQTRKLLKDGGASMENFFVSSPKCTPSRSAWLSGRYYHNIRPNGATSGRGLNTTNHFDQNALFPLLHSAGYQTGVFGKIHNDQAEWLCNAKNHTEPFTHIETECRPCGGYYREKWVVKEDDDAVTHLITIKEDDPWSTYSEAQYGNRTINWIRKVAKAGQPFFAYVGTTGPHLGVVPAPWHRLATEHMNVSAPRTPNFNQLASDHFSMLASAPELDKTAIEFEDRIMRDRWGALMSIDDLVADIVKTLDEEGVLDNTYVLFSSDHGYHLGQFRIPDEKMLPYETDIRVTFWIRGPGITSGTVVPQLTANIDIAPTLVDLAGLSVPAIMDGKSMKPLLHPKRRGAPVWRTSFITEFAEGAKQLWGTNNVWKLQYVEGQPADENVKPPMGPADGKGTYQYDCGANQWRQLRVLNATHDFSFTEWDHEYVFDNIEFCEYYNITADPWQRKNLCPQLTQAERASLHAELQTFYECRGDRTRASNCP